MPELPQFGLASTELDEALAGADVALIVTAHPGIDHNAIAARMPTVDFRGVTRTRAARGAPAGSAAVPCEQSRRAHGGGGMKRLLIVADHSFVVHAIRLALRQTAGFQVVGFVDGRSPIRARRSTSSGPTSSSSTTCSCRRERDRPPARGRRARAATPRRMLLTIAMDDEWLERGLRGRRRRRPLQGACTRSRSARCCARSRRATSSTVPRRPRAGHRRRTARSPTREMEILRPRRARATPTARIARELWVTEQTVKFHLSNTYRKLGVANRTEATRYALHARPGDRRVSGWPPELTAATADSDALTPPRAAGRSAARGVCARAAARAASRAVASARCSSPTSWRSCLARAAPTSLAEQIGPPAVIAPTWLLVALVPRRSRWLARALRRLPALRGPVAGDRAARASTRSATLFNALLAGSLLLLVVGQGLKKGFDIVASTRRSRRCSSSASRSCSCRRCAASCAPGCCPSVMRPRRTLIVGAGATGRLLERKIAAHPEYGLEFVGFVDDDAAAPDVLGTTSDLTELRRRRPRSTGSSSPPRAAPHEETLDLVREVRRPDVHLSIVPNYFELFASNAAIEDIEGIPVVEPAADALLAQRPRRSSAAFDIARLRPRPARALAVLLAASRSRSSSTRAARCSSARRATAAAAREFQIVKFRTMVADAEAPALRRSPT